MSSLNEVEEQFSNQVVSIAYDPDASLVRVFHDGMSEAEAALTCFRALLILSGQVTEIEEDDE